MGAQLQSSSRARWGRGARRKPMSEINVTPFVDVMLVLLIIFMVTAPLLTVGVQVDLPQTRAAVIPGRDEPISVSVNREGKIFIQDTEVELNALGARLTAIAGNNPDARIFVRGDKGINYGRVMETMGAINAAGFGKVALVSEQAQDARRPPRRAGAGGAKK
jgi:biopolymer transport protein TolR